ncbi:class I SAM-dependent methyltransferase [Kaistella palustris]|uniref:class I SAM-dependent methyltransferase n=1 Tax=Kaistella palustris TaxID=493376 RepID=UPI0004009B2F|nr:class I SAM-dependent methyltransferase [Kaistella palustris]
MAWFETWFDTPYYHILYKNRDFREAENFISLLTAHLQIPENSTIIDLACGKGRHSIYLNKMGFNVLGVDLSKESIFHNKQFETTGLRFDVHDMRDEIYPTVSPAKADAVFNLFTSFGYFDKAEDDRKVFRSISHVLKDEGYFVLDFLNEKWVRKTLVPEYVTRKGNIDFHIKKRIDEQHIIKDINFTDKGKKHHYFEKVKLHTLEEIGNYAADFGFETVDIFGDYDLGAFDLEKSPRCINIFRKKS